MAVLRYFYTTPGLSKNVRDALDYKVDKEDGMGLSQNDYTDAEKDKLEGIENGAEVNVQSDWNQADTESDAYIQNKPESLPASDVYEWAKQPTKPTYTPVEIGLGNVTNDAQVKRSEMGVANGVATLNQDGLVPSTQLPSYVDDVLEYSGVSQFPRPGTDGKIYIDTTTNITYRWSGSDYVEISKSLALGETSSTAYRGDRGKTAYTHATDSSRLTTATSVGLYKVGCTAQGHISGLTAITKADITGLGIPAQDTNTTYTFAGGANKFTVTPSGGTAQDVTVTPSITRNVTGATTWTAANVITTTNAASGNVIKESGVTISTSAPTSSSTDTVIPTSKAVYSAINSNKYTLPTASASVLGGVKVGTNLSISNGVLSATDTTYSNATEEAAGLMSAADKTVLDGLSVLSPVVKANRNTSNSAQWIIFASIDYPSISRYDDIVLLVQGLGYYYTGQNTGCWIVECRTKYNDGTNPNTIGMTVTELSPRGSNGTVEFGYYTDSTAGKTYFGVYTSTRHHYIETVKLGGQNIEHLKTRIVLTEAPTGWVYIDTREYLTETDCSMTYSTDTSGTNTYSLTIGGSTWDIKDRDTRYQNFSPSGTTAASGLVPKPSTTSGTTKYLREDATWAVPPNTTYSAGTGLSLSGTTFSLALTKALVTTALGYTPPTSDTNTHRPIQVNGTQILGDNTTALNLKAGSNVSLSNSSGTVTIAATDTTYPSVTLWGQTFNHNNDVNGYIHLTNASRYHRIYASNGSNSRGLISYDSGDATNLKTGYWMFYEYSPNSTASPTSTGSAEIYSLPTPTKGLTESVAYNILTTKNLGFSITGNAATATKLATARTISLTGDATGSTTFDGSANKSISVSIDDMTGATSSANGAHGLAPQPLKADRFKFLRGDGTWAFPNDTLTVKTSQKNAVTIDASTASIYVLKMSGSITNITVNNAVKGQNIWAICVNSSAAARTVKVVYNMDSTPQYMCYNGTDLSIEVAAGGNRIVSFIYDGTTFYVNWW